MSLLLLFGRTPAVTASSAGTPFADTTNAASYATASWTPTTNRLALVTVTNSDASSAILPTLTGNGLTWEQVQTSLRADSTKRVTVFRAWTTGASAGALTADFGGDNQTGCQIHISQWAGTAGSGNNGAGAIVQAVAAAFSSVANPSITLAAFADAVNNAAMGAFEFNDDPAVGSGFTLLSETTYASPSSFAITEYKNGQDLGVDITATSGSGVGIAIEIAAAASVTSTATWEQAAATWDATASESIPTSATWVQAAASWDAVASSAEDVTGTASWEQAAASWDSTATESIPASAAFLQAPAAWDAVASTAEDVTGDATWVQEAATWSATAVSAEDVTATATWVQAAATWTATGSAGTVETPTHGASFRPDVRTQMQFVTGRATFAQAPASWHAAMQTTDPPRDETEELLLVGVL